MGKLIIGKIDELLGSRYHERYRIVDHGNGCLVRQVIMKIGSCIGEFWGDEMDTEYWEKIHEYLNSLKVRNTPVK